MNGTVGFTQSLREEHALAKGLRSKKKRLVVSLLIALAILVCSGAIIHFLLRSKLFKASDSTHHTINIPSSPVVALGVIVPGDAIVHLTGYSANGAGVRLSRLLVRENDVVTANQVVGILDTFDSLQADAARANAQVEAKQAALNKVLAGNSAYEITAQQSAVERLRSEVERQTADFRRYQELHNDGLISNSDWESHSTSFRSASASLQEAQATLGRSSEVRPEDVAIAKADLLTEQAALQSAKTNLKQAFVRAPAAGRILHISTWPGEKLADQGVLDMAATNEMFADAEVYETDLDRVRLDQPATITSSVLKEPLHGRVSRIGRALQRQQVVNIDPAANTDARIALVRVRLDSASREMANRFINLQVRVEMQP